MKEAGGAGDQRSSSSGGGGGSMRSAVEKERTKLRERQRRSITTKIFHGLRKHGGYPLSPRADINQVLRHLAQEAGWIVEPDGTTYRSSSPTSTITTTYRSSSPIKSVGAYLVETLRSSLPDAVKKVLEEGINLYKLHTSRHGNLNGVNQRNLLSEILLSNSEYLDLEQVPFKFAVKKLLEQLKAVAKGEYTAPIIKKRGLGAYCVRCCEFAYCKNP